MWTSCMLFRNLHVYLASVIMNKLFCWKIFCVSYPIAVYEILLLLIMMIVALIYNQLVNSGTTIAPAYDQIDDSSEKYH